MNKFLLKKNNGFTLIETLVAISILMIAVVGPMVFVSNGIKASYYARDQITAFYLAQDAVEALRFIRDNDRISLVNGSQDWETFSNTLSACMSPQKCAINSYEVYEEGEDGPSISAGYNSSIIRGNKYDDELYLDDNGYYVYGPGASRTETKFKRWFTYTLDDNNTPTEVRIEVTVDWSSGVTPRNFTVYEDLFYWR